MTSVAPRCPGNGGPQAIRRHQDIRPACIAVASPKHGTGAGLEPGDAGGLQTLGRSESASTSRSVDVRGCGLATEMRSRTGHVAHPLEHVRQNRTRLIRCLIVVDDLSESWTSTRPVAHASMTSRDDVRHRASVRGRARVGATQNEQNSLHPSMMVTQAARGSECLATPNGKDTSSCGFVAMRACRVGPLRPAAQARAVAVWRAHTTSI